MRRIKADFFELRTLLERLWILLRDRPFIRCPACHGEGGEQVGYYEPEWSECWACYDSWADAEDHYMEWAVGGIDPLRWPGACLGEFWHWRCAIGLHHWDEEQPVCTRCWESKRARSG